MRIFTPSSAAARPGRRPAAANSAASANDERKPRVRADSSVFTRSSRARRTLSFDCAPASSNGLPRSGTSPFCALSSASRSASAIGTFFLIGTFASRIAFVPPRSARSPALSSELVSSGATSARPSTRPACLAETVIAPLRTIPASASSEARVSTGTASPSPMPQKASAIATSAFETRGSSASATRPAASSAAPPHTAAHGESPRPSERASSVAGRERADHERAGDRLQSPDRDHEQHGEEERADERREDEPERSVRRQRAPLAPPRRLVLERDRPAGGEQRKAGDRRLNHEDRAPVEELREHAAEHRTERRAEHGNRRPERGAGRPRAAQPSEQRERRRQEQRGAESLDAAEDDQRRQIPRRGAADRGDREEREPHLRAPARIEAPPEQRQPPATTATTRLYDVITQETPTMEVLNAP